MGALRFNVPQFNRPISESLARLPRAFRDDAERGFRILAYLPESQYDAVIQGAIFVMENRRPPVEQLKEMLAINQAEASSVLSAAMVVVPLFGGQETNPASIIEAAGNVGLISAEARERLVPFMRKVASYGPQITTVIKKSSLAEQVMPSFTDIDIAVDVRLGFSAGKVDVVVPVALIHIDTDSNDSEIWFQCSRQQLQVMKEDIDEALSKMDAADEWGSRS